MNYQVIDFDSWDRKELFTLYTTSLKVAMNLTAEVDVTPIINFSKTKGYKFYPCMIWAVTKVVNATENFKYSIKDGKVIKWNEISPSYTDFNNQTKKFNKFVTEYKSDFNAFYNAVMIDREKYKNQTGFLPNQPENVFDITCLPWINYKNFTMHVDAGIRLFPIVSWGKYEEKNGKFVMPVTLDLNHAVGDGYDVSIFFKNLQDFINGNF